MKCFGKENQNKEIHVQRDLLTQPTTHFDGRIRHQMIGNAIGKGAFPQTLTLEMIPQG